MGVGATALPLTSCTVAGDRVTPVNLNFPICEMGSKAHCGSLGKMI